MAKEDITDLAKFLQPFPENVKETAWWLRTFLWHLFPSCNELIYDNYNAVAVGFGPTEKVGDVFCSFAVYSKHVNFGFNRGSEISDPDKILKGSGSLYRHVTVMDKNDFPKAYMKKLLKEAFANAMARLKQDAVLTKGKTITKSISPNKRRPV